MSRVLIVEDEPSIRRIIGLLLREAGMESIALPDAESARRVLEFETPDCIVTDVRLPGKDGVAFTQEIRDNPELTDVPVTLVSAFGEPSEHTADEFVAKPFDIDALTSTIEKFVNDSAPGERSSRRKRTRRGKRHPASQLEDREAVL